MDRMVVVVVVVDIAGVVVVPDEDVVGSRDENVEDDARLKVKSKSTVVDNCYWRCQ